MKIIAYSLFLIVLYEYCDNYLFDDIWELLWRNVNIWLYFIDIILDVIVGVTKSWRIWQMNGVN